MLTEEQIDLTSEQMLELIKIREIGLKNNKWKSIKQRQEEKKEEMKSIRWLWNYLGVEYIENE